MIARPCLLAEIACGPNGPAFQRILLRLPQAKSVVFAGYGDDPW